MMLNLRQEEQILHDTADRIYGNAQRECRALPMLEARFGCGSNFL